jgi:cell division protein FtsL
VSAPASRVLTVRRPLVRGREGRVLHVVRGWLVRRALGLGVVLVALCVARVWLTHQVRAVAYDLSEARRIQLRLEHEQRELEIELATLRDPRRLGAEARRRLGLVEPTRGQVVVLP